MNAEPNPAKAIFLEAVERHAPEQWPDFLDRACAGQPDLRGRVEALLEAHREVGTARRDEFPDGTDARPVATVDEPPLREQAGAMIGPYKFIEPIGEGGMGTVWMAQQSAPVKRLVAVKLIKAGMDSRQVIARFEAERQALALMDHPNIARVLDAGATPAGRPYFAMELVKGIPITGYCDERRLSVRERLELFVPVCHAVQHAHQKGIIHRDLKPSNVLVAPFDGVPVVKVIDFGVAKATGQPLTERTLATGFGAVVGTLEYMSPEQAELNNLDIDTRSDIYALGVLLYELLTGTTPLPKKRLSGAAFAEVLRMIREEEPPRPSTRLSTTEELPSIAANRGAEPGKLSRLVRGELDWIVMKALEKDRSRRYETANGLAMDVHRYLADEPVQACPPSAGYRLRKFVRRNKGGLAAAALVLCFLVLLGSGVGWALRDRAARNAKVAGQVGMILAEVDRLEGEQRWPDALAAARRAEAAAAGLEADSMTAQQVRARVKGLVFIDRLEQIRMQRATCVGGTFDYPGAIRGYARAFREYGVDVEELPVETSIDRLKARPALAIPVAAALDDWAEARRVVAGRDAPGWKGLVAVACGIDPEPLRDRLRSTWGQPVSSEMRDELRRLARSIDTRAQHPTTLVSLARALRRVEDPDAALKLLRDGQHVYPGDYWLNFQLAASLDAQKDYEGAIRFLTAAVAIRPNSNAALNNLGSALRDQGRLDEAVASLRKAIEIDPGHAHAHSTLGHALRTQNKPEEASAAFRKAIAAFHKAIESDPKDTLAYNGLGAILCDVRRDYEDASACFRKAIELEPNDAGLHFNLGNALRGQRKWDEAIAAWRKAIELDPKLASAYTNLGGALLGQGKLEEAIAAHRKAIELDPKSAPAYTSLGNALHRQRKLEEAVAAWRKAIELDPKSADAHINLALALRDQRKWDEAIAAFRKAIELDPKDAGAFSDLGAILCDVRRDFENASVCFRKAIELDPTSTRFHYNLGTALTKQRKLDEAVACFRKAIELDPRYARAYDGLGNALCAQGKLPDAMAAHRKAIELDPKSANAHCDLANTFYAQKKLDEAIAAYRKAIELDPRHAKAHHNLGQALKEQRRPEEAIAAYRKAIELDPKLGGTHNDLGIVLYQQKKLDGAIACYRKAIEIDPKDARAYSNLGIVLRDQRKWDAAIAAFRKAVELDPKLASAYTSLGAALRDQGKLEEAMAAHRKAIELDPKSAPAYWNLGGALVQQGKLDDAASAFRKAGELEPEFAGAGRVAMALNELAWGLATHADPARRDPVRAVRLAREAVERHPQEGNYHNTLGVALYRARRWKESVAALGTSMELRQGGDSNDWFFLAMAHRQLGEKDKAREWYDRAVQWMDRNQPKNEEVHRIRAEAAELLGLKEKK